MALFSQHPPGVQIKRWMTILTTLVVVLDVIAAGSLFVVTNLMNSIVNRYEPLVMKSGEISSKVYQVQSGLYQYLGSYRQDTSGIREEVGRLRGLIGEAFKIPGAQDLGADLQEIDVTLEKYDKILQLLPKIAPGTNWSEVEEFKNQAIQLGGQVEQLAAKMKRHADDQIADKAARSGAVASVALWVFIAFFALSLVIVVLLLIWWRDFQEMMLAL